MIFFRKIIKYFLILFLALNINTNYLKPNTLNNCLLKISHDTTYDHLYFELNPKYLNILDLPKSQTLAHLLNSSISFDFIDDYKYKYRVKEIGTKKIESLLNQALTKENELEKNYYVFYHGQKREFLLFQDLYENLSKIVNNKTFSDFLLLRIPDPSFDQFKKTQDFLKYFNYKVNDSYDPARKLLLSVNPSLFGNSVYHDGSSSTFRYFITSTTAFAIDTETLTKDLFNHFKIESFYYKYKPELDNLLTLLSSFETKKTGLLLQIFIPKKSIPNIIYRSKARGVPFYTYQNNKFKLNSPIPIHEELDSYKNGIFIANDNPDEVQFRILLTNDIMLNPNSGIKIFRYYNETENIKKYKQDLDNLVKKIKLDLNTEIKNKKIKPNIFKFLS